MGSILKAEELVRNYKLPTAEDGVVKGLKGLDFQIEENEFVGIMGKSGCGKTTLLKLLGLIDRPTKGELYFKDRKVNELWMDELADIRRREIGFVFQDFYLMDSLTVEENIMLPMILDKAEEEKCFACARKHAEHFRIDHLTKKYPYELSGGERQRVAICRALINEPDLILADEPTGNLDEDTAQDITEILKESAHKMNKCVVVVTHSNELAKQADVVFRLKKGELQVLERVQDGATQPQSRRNNAPRSERRAH